MPHVILPDLLSRRTESRGRIAVNGATAGDAVRILEQRYPSLKGWVLDDRGHVRQHVKLFVNGTEASLETGVRDTDELYIVPAISGG